MAWQTALKRFGWRGYSSILRRSFNDPQDHARADDGLCGHAVRAGILLCPVAAPPKSFQIGNLSDVKVVLVLVKHDKVLTICDTLPLIAGTVETLRLGGFTSWVKNGWSEVARVFENDVAEQHLDRKRHQHQTKHSLP